MLKKNQLELNKTKKKNNVKGQVNIETNKLQNDTMQDNEITNENDTKHSEEKTGWWS